LNSGRAVIGSGPGSSYALLKQYQPSECIPRGVGNPADGEQESTFFRAIKSRPTKMTHQVEVVNSFLRAVGEGDFVSARKQLANDLTFQGPFDTFADPDSYLKAVRALYPIVKKVSVRKLFEAGDDICLLYDMETNTPIGTALICEWFTVRDRKIVSILAVFDARPFAPMFSR
jgi:SnoaL-like domain